MPFSVNLYKELDTLDKDTKRVLINVLEEIDRNISQSVRREDFNELKEIVRELSEAQKKTEIRLEELADLHKKTEQVLYRLVDEHKKTREQLGGLSHSFGYVLEDRAYKGLPELLKKDFGIELIEPLKRDYIQVGKNRYVEVNIIGKGKRYDKEVLIIGDSKTQLKKTDIDNFLYNVRKIEKNVKNKIILIAVTFQASPQVREYAKEKGIKLYFSYEFS